MTPNHRDLYKDHFLAVGCNKITKASVSAFDNLPVTSGIYSILSYTFIKFDTNIFTVFVNQNRRSVITFIYTVSLWINHNFSIVAGESNITDLSSLIGSSTEYSFDIGFSPSKSRNDPLNIGVIGYKFRK